MATESKTPKQVMDVSKPDKTPASASSRPIIIGHTPEVQDPMVTAVEDKNPDVVVDQEQQAIAPQGKKVIKPLSEEEVALEATTEPEPEKTETGAVPDKDDSNFLNDNDSALDDEDTKTGDKGKQNEEADVDVKQQEKIESLVASKKFFVPIGKARRRKSRMTTLLIVFIIVGLVGIAVIAIDAEIIDIGVELPFNIMPQ